MGSWVKDGTEYLERYASTLEALPVWLFSSGPLKGSTKGAKDGAPVDPIENALGPLTGPGAVVVVRWRTSRRGSAPRPPRLLRSLRPERPPANLSERFVRSMPGSKGILPPGDFRDWPEIEAWAREISRVLMEPVAVG